tara:strand:+ start:3812 stop:4216 length:405 start_codon:yes stop_codon:yes gene_type:complete
MITIYLLEKCEACKKILEYIISNPNSNICLIILSKNDAINFKKNKIYNNVTFPLAFNSPPKPNGLPYNNSRFINNSDKILKMLKYLNNKKNNNSFLSNIIKKKNCFGKICHTSKQKKIKPMVIETPLGILLEIS